MKFNATKVYQLLFVITILLQLYLSSFKINILFQLFILVVFFYFEGFKIPKSLVKFLIPLVSIFFLGFAGTIINNYELFNVFKDISHFIKPLLGLSIGYLFFKKINNFELFIKAIVCAGLISAILHFIIILFFSNFGSVSGIREFGRDNFLELFALFFLVFYKKFKTRKIFDENLYYIIIILIISLSVIAYFSRTMIVVAIITLITIYGYSIITLRTIKFCGLFFIAIFAFYIYLFSIKIDRENFLYKIRNVPAEIFETKINRENHSDLWDHWRAYEAKRAFELMKQNPTSFIFGCGYGSLVNLKFFAPLNDDKKGLKYISELHNGFMYLLYKTGILGILIYFMFLINMYKKIYHNKDIITTYISAIGLTYIFTTITITGIYNGRDILIFILGALLFFNFSSNQSKHLRFSH